MEFRIEKEDALRQMMLDKKRKELLKDYNRVLNIFHAAPDFETLPQLHHLDLKRDDLKEDHFSVRLDQSSRLSCKKLTSDSISILSIS
jgi:hypothetical protein